MPGTVIGKTLNFGYPGQISRNGDEISRTRPVKQGTDNIPFGAAVVVEEDGTCRLVKGGDTSAKIAGIAMRRVKSAITWQAQNNGEYFAGEPCDILERGAVTVECANGTPVVGGDVYVYLDNSTGKKAGQFSAAADGSATVKLENARFATGVDARNVAEVVLVTRQGV